MTMSPVVSRPLWLQKKISLAECERLTILFQQTGLNTVCQHAQCPNISECFGAGVATFLILGATCTRGCEFCAVQKGKPQPLDSDEPRRVAEAVQQLGLRHVVITSVTRDDLTDGGAAFFAETISHIRALNQSTAIEILIPDFQGRKESVEIAMKAKPDIVAHNLETVRRLYPQVRSGSDYSRSVSVLGYAKEYDASIQTKSGIMLGLGETEQEVVEVFDDLRLVGCNFLSIGQYLAPSTAHVLVKEYIHPEKFQWYRRKAMAMGFGHVESGPYVRSSYQAHRYYRSRGVS